MAFNSTLATFSFFVFVFGLIMSYLTIDQHSKLPSTCTSNKVQTGFNIILMLSLMMVIIPIVQLFCHWGCGCPQTNLWYRWIVVGILSLMIAAGSTVLSGLSDSKCSLASAKSFMGSLVGVSVTLIVIILVFTGWQTYKGVGLAANM